MPHTVTFPLRLGLLLAAILAFFLNAYAFVLYQLEDCYILDGRGLPADDFVAAMCGRDNSLVSVSLATFVIAGILSLAGLVACWRGAGTLAKVAGCALVVLAPVATYAALALVTS
ncbi:hypothetical protein [Nocardioides sp.]|uniref:hypothetical protein n=1 Tax=Nocardioides sp. TaxID=35761 RepID=UPI0031FE5917|nr:hypothetical protein [Nocardioides sp.]